MFVSLFVGLLSYWNWTNIGISPVLEETFFWNFLETFPGCWHTNSKWIWILCLSVSLLFGLLLYWNHTNIDNSSSGWYILLIFLGDTLGTLIHYFQIILIFCMSVSLLFGSLSYWNHINIEISPVLDKIVFWNFLETFQGCWYTISKYFWISCMSVSLLVGWLSY